MRELAATYAARVIYADSFPNGVDQVVGACRGERASLRTLTMFDHASSDHVAISDSDYGSGDFSQGSAVTHLDRQGKPKKLVIAPGEAHVQFARLKPLFDGTGFIILRGCELAGNTIPLLISRSVPMATVIAYYDKQNIMGAVRPNGNSGRWKNGRSLGVWKETEDLPDMY